MCLANVFPNLSLNNRKMGFIASDLLFTFTIDTFILAPLSVAVDDSLRDAAQELVDHDGLVLLGHAVKGFLDDMAAEGVHAEVQSVALDSLCN